MRLLFLVLSFVLVGCGASTADLNYARGHESPLLVNHVHTTAPDTLGGVSVRLGFVNAGEKPWKYLDLQVEPYNQFGDIAGDRSAIRWTGLVEPGQDVGNEIGGYAGFPVLWYDRTIYCANVLTAKITFVDNSIWESDSPERFVSPGIRKC